MNVTGVWSQGITGKGVVVAILDDGLQMDHPDLKENYVTNLSCTAIFLSFLLTMMCSLLKARMTLMTIQRSPDLGSVMTRMAPAVLVKLQL